MELERVKELYESAITEMGKVIVGQRGLVEGFLLALFAEGSVLIEGVPGLGKTLAAKVLARTISCKFRRVQFTPDLMPSDLTGHNIYDIKEQRFNFNPGPIFTNLLLADEINRTPPKTQSALLEIMEETQVTIDGVRHPIDRPFIVMATQNPLEHEGTYPLPEAQVDRFMFKLLVDYPELEDEVRILGLYSQGKDPHDLDAFGLTPVLTGQDVIEAQGAVAQVIVEEQILRYITAIVSRTRAWESVSVGASPRGSVNLMLASRTLAGCQGRDFVVPDDVKEVAPAVLRHRIRLRPEAEIEGVTVEDVVGGILDSVEVPRA